MTIRIKIVILTTTLCSACAGQPPATPGPAQAPPPASTAEPSAMGSADADAGSRDALQREAADLDAAVRKARERIEAGGVEVTAEARADWVKLEKRYAEVRRQLQELGGQASERASKVSDEAKGAVTDLRRDVDRLVDRLKK